MTMNINRMRVLAGLQPLNEVKNPNLPVLKYDQYDEFVATKVADYWGTYESNISLVNEENSDFYDKRGNLKKVDFYDFVGFLDDDGVADTKAYEKFEFYQAGRNGRKCVLQIWYKHIQNHKFAKYDFSSPHQGDGDNCSYAFYDEDAKEELLKIFESQK